MEGLLLLFGLLSLGGIVAILVMFIFVRALTNIQEEEHERDVRR